MSDTEIVMVLKDLFSDYGAHVGLTRGERHQVEMWLEDKIHVEPSPLEIDYKLVKNWAEEHSVRRVRVCNLRGGLVVEDITGDFMNADDIYISKNAVSQNTVEKYYLPIGELLQEIKERMKYKF